MGPPREIDVAIVGGGLGGLALAVGLLRRGFNVHVFEGARELRRETSTMIGLGPNGFTALGDLHPGIPDSLRKRGCMLQEVSFRSLPPDREHSSNTRGGDNHCNIRWAETQDVLAKLVPTDIIHLDHAVTGYDEIWDEQDELVAGGGGGSGPAARPASRAVVHFRSQPSVTARLVVGADGVFSAVRAAMFPGDPGPRYLGHMNWNCVFPNSGGNTLVDAHKPGQLIVAQDSSLLGATPREMTLQMMVADAGQGYTFVQVRIQSDEPSFTTELSQADEEQAQAATENRISQVATRYCCECSEAEEGDGTCSEGGSGQRWRRGRGGMGVPGSKARVLGALKSAGWGWAVPILEAVPESCLFERALYDRLPLERWSSRGGRVVLLGDSAHAMHPGPGQGARSAFEDAHQLVLALEAQWPDVPSALERYQRARIVRANTVQRFSAEMAGLAPIRNAARPAGLSVAERAPRMREFYTWFNQYPANMDGDPDSTWWKPPTPTPTWAPTPARGAAQEAAREAPQEAAQEALQEAAREAPQEAAHEEAVHGPASGAATHGGCGKVVLKANVVVGVVGQGQPEGSGSVRVRLLLMG
ncbi:hypothetical protein GPECTOR_11g46 [Gonium pectorale]|uniref:FAD-binding domain-containing protein n=1 Tax=Gonium pectorale TaxID=33097 RepID=A0A150GQ11_GONPE|nr:hypothetical protein GPECTOR_11g46 [Gonium pectorale]|eukprot:KXZ51919.1 hypothetical protein GPECTOR_11g46 [Gonium pectorale]